MFLLDMSSAIFARLKNGRIEVKCNKVFEMLHKAYGESAMNVNVHFCTPDTMH
jgi:hypothetical protein